MTRRLYFDDPLRATFDARVVAHGSFGGRPSVVLEHTAFYPESGGQMADRGVLGGARVIDVQVDDADVVHHLVDGELPAIGTELSATVDMARRRVHMALHTGQHMLSRALADVARGETVSSRLGETGCTIDIDRDKIDDAELARAEELVNAVVDDDVPVRAWFPEPAELRELPLRRAPKVTDNVRVVKIGDFDVSPCGGTHCLRSAQVGFVRVTGVERYKGKIRVSFAAGRRARDEVASEAAVIRGLGKMFTCGPHEVPAAIEKLRRELAEARDALGHARARLAEGAADALLAAASGDRVVAVLDGADAEYLRVVAKKLLAARPDLAVMLAAPTAEGTRVLVARGTASTFDCGAFLKRAATAAGGRGGGRAEQAEGNLPAGIDWLSIVAIA